MDPKDKAELLKENQHGLALADQGKFEEAKGCFEALIDQFPEDRDAYFNMGMVCVKEGKDSDALECFQQLLTVAPNDSEALKEIERLRAKTGK